MTKSINILHLKSISWDYILIIELENGFYATLTLYSEELLSLFKKGRQLLNYC
jgi:hypothetical protein